MPTIRPWDGDPTRILVLPDRTEHHYRARVRERFRALAQEYGYRLEPSIRTGNSKGLQAWSSAGLAGEYNPNGTSAWLRLPG